MMSRILLSLALLSLLLVPATSSAQDVRTGHTSPRPLKCKKCAVAYQKAVDYVVKEANDSTFAAKMVIGWLFLADLRYQKELKAVIESAKDWKKSLKYSQHAKNWHPALAGILLAEYNRYYPNAEVQKEIANIVQHFKTTQERTGGWFKWFEGAYNDRPDYAVKDLGMLTAMIYGFLWNVKAQGIPVEGEMLKRAQACLYKNLTARGISYGTGSKATDPCGSRGAFAILGLDSAQQHKDKIYRSYQKLLPTKFKNLRQGHHVGAFHALGVVLASRRLGPKVYRELTTEWLDKLIDEQQADGSVYIDDDKDSGGEKKLLKGREGSTAAFALMILLQDPAALPPPRKSRPPSSGGMLPKKSDEPPSKKKQ